MMHRRVRPAGAMVGMFLFAASPALGQFTRMSVGPGGEQLPANASLYAPSISDDGRRVVYAFIEDGVIDPADANGAEDMYLYDATTGTNTRLLTDSVRPPASSYISEFTLSGDGQWVVFGVQSCAQQLCKTDMFLYEIATGVITLVSRTPTGEAPVAGESVSASVSYDGRFVAFMSTSIDIVAPDVNDNWDVFVFDRQTGLVERISEDAMGTQVNGRADYPSISDDGRYVAFGSYSTSLEPTDNTFESDVHVFDRQTGQMRRLSQRPDGSDWSGGSFLPRISGDGSTVIFQTLASDAFPGRGFGFSTSIVKADRASGSLVDITPAGPPGSELCTIAPLQVSDDGSLVLTTPAFCSPRPGAERGGNAEAILINTLTAETVGVPRTYGGSVVSARYVAISGNGETLAFVTDVALVAQDTSGGNDAYLGAWCDEAQITRQPLDAVAGAGSAVNLVAEAVGFYATYQWIRDGVPLTDGGPISGATTPILTINPAGSVNEGAYRLIVSSDCGPAVSNLASLTVIPEPCPGDADGSGVVEFPDIVEVLRNWNSACP
ncbi:MAG: hypothetical protein SFZ24_00035 [Planctomycetota bacterium]|nr:hypothetical protein [Planctomycetota bacterium]